MDYNVPLGKLNRGMAVADVAHALAGAGGKELSEQELFQANALGWCIEFLQARGRRRRRGAAAAARGGVLRGGGGGLAAHLACMTAMHCFLAARSLTALRGPVHIKCRPTFWWRTTSWIRPSRGAASPAGTASPRWAGAPRGGACCAGARTPGRGVAVFTRALPACHPPPPRWAWWPSTTASSWRPASTAS